MTKKILFLWLILILLVVGCNQNTDNNDDRNYNGGYEEYYDEDPYEDEYIDEPYMDEDISDDLPLTEDEYEIPNDEQLYDDYDSQNNAGNDNTNSNGNCLSFEKYDSINDECYIECSTEDECQYYDSMYDNEQTGYDDIPYASEGDGYNDKQTKEDCFDFELYDEVDQICYVDCETMEECSQYDKLYDQIFQGEYEDYNLDEANVDFNEDNLDQIREEVIANYLINNDSSLTLINKTTNQNYIKFAEMTSDHQLIWKYYLDVFEEEPFTEYLTQFQVFTDGKDGTIAFMALDDETFKWAFGVDIQDSIMNGEFVDKKDFIYTLVHEYGHLLTLNSIQVSHQTTEGSCTTYFEQEGCLKSESYLYNFHKEFWKGNFMDEFNKITNDEEYNTFYEKHKDKFITDYAATNQAEDIAETFAYFVLKDKPQATTVAHNKVLSFYNYPELVKLRNDIRANIAEIDPNIRYRKR